MLNHVSTDNLPNYIRSARKATGLSVKDLAYLLGHSSGSCVSHYEAFNRTPTLVTALQLHIALDRPFEELFTGLHEDALRQVSARADLLLTEEFRASVGPARLTGRKQWLERLAGDNQTILPI